MKLCHDLRALLDDPFSASVTRWLCRYPRTLQEIAWAFGLECADTRARLVPLLRAKVLFSTRTALDGDTVTRVYRTRRDVYRTVVRPNARQPIRPPHAHARLRGIEFHEEALAHGAMTGEDV
jgi:hypothetical protein